MPGGTRPRRMSRLPLTARLLLRLLLNRQDSRSVINDLSELYQRRLVSGGERAARAWLRRQVASYPRRIAVERLRRLMRGEVRRRGVSPSVVGRAGAVERLWRDLRHAARSLSRVPILSATIVLTVGLGIGATAAIFGAINAVLIEPLPYADPGKLVRIFTDSPPNRWPLSVADYRALEQQQTSFSGVAGYNNVTVTFNRDDFAERIQGKFVTWDYFTLLGVTPLYGRSFNESDGKPESEPTVIISHGLWNRHFGADPAVLGRPIQLDGRSYTVVGVLPRAVGPLEQRRDFFAAVEWQQPPRKGPFFIIALARIKPGIDGAAAARELRAINARIFPVWRDSYQDEGASWGMMELKRVVVGDIGTTLILVLGAVGFLLLIASSNAANLLLARATERSRELAVRSALGASRGRLLQHVLAESSLLAVGGALIGLLVACSGMRLLTTAGADYIPRTPEVGMTARVLWFWAVVTVSSGFLFGLIPSLSCAKIRFEQALRSGSRSSTDGAGARRIRRALVVSQFAVAAPLLIGAGLLVGSLERLQDVSPGFDTRNILTVRVTLPEEVYQDPSDVRAFWDAALERVRSHPGVAAVAYSNSRPPNQVSILNNFDLEDDPTPPSGAQPVVPWAAVSSGYFAVLGVSLIEGRMFDNRDVEDAPPVVLVDQTWANRFFPGAGAVGRRLHSGGQTTEPLTTVIGVVGNVKYMGLDAADLGTVYEPMTAGTYRSRFFIVRTFADPMTVVPHLRAVVRQLDPSLPLAQVATIDEVISDSLQAPRYLAFLSAAFAAAALVLSVVGIYGLMSHYVQQHAKDIGIRIALGGGPTRVLGVVVGQGLKLAAIGVSIGIIGALFLTRFMTGLLFGIRATDIVTFSGVSLLMLSVAVVASLLPARRAAAVDPVNALREE
jgi:putative ABC transport system permease protein